MPKEIPKDSVSAENSTSHPDESKGMKLARMRFWVFFFRKGRKCLENFSVQRRVFCRKGDDFFLFWSTGNEKSTFWKEAEERKNLR